jgi:hypothetical protein
LPGTSGKHEYRKACFSGTGISVFGRIKAPIRLFCKPVAVCKASLPEVSRPSLIANNDEPDELISKIYENMGKKDYILFY